MSEALLTKDSPTIDDITPAAGYSSGQVIQLPDGRAAVVLGLQALVENDPVAFATEGQYTIAKTASVVILPGGRVFWDRSANTATPLQIAAGADFYVGTAVDGAASADTTVKVAMNVKPAYLVDLHADAFDTALVNAATLSMRGGSAYLSFTTATEAQKADLLSVKSVPVAIPMILESIFRIETVCDADVGDLSVGLVNATHASDADSITESALFHQDSGADLNLDAESDDGTVEVGATDTTFDIVAGTDVEVWLDARDLTNIKYYVNGVEKCAATSNLGDIRLAVGPLKALFHWEKSSNDSPGEARVSHLAIRTTDVAA